MAELKKIIPINIDSISFAFSKSALFRLRDLKEFFSNFGSAAEVISDIKLYMRFTETRSWSDSLVS